MVEVGGGTDSVPERDHEIYLLSPQILNRSMLLLRPRPVHSTSRDVKKGRLVYICDWLPPDFGAVGQYAMLFAREWAKDGWQVTLVGLTSGEPRREAPEPFGDGTLQVIRVRRPPYEKQK